MYLTDTSIGLILYTSDTNKEVKSLLNLKELRKERGLTQHGLSALSGVSRPQIARLETGRELRACKTDVVAKLAMALGVTIDYLIHGDKEVS